MKRKTRDRVLMAGVGAVAAGTLALVGTHLAGLQPPAPDVVRAQAKPPVSGDFEIQFLGDTMLGDGATDVMRTNGPGYPLEGVAPMVDADYTVVNLETAVSSRRLSPLIPGKGYVYKSAPAGVQELTRAGVDAFGLGNNHALDLGRSGLLDTQAAVREAGGVTFGAGVDLAEAEQPLLVDAGDRQVAVVSLGEDFGSLLRASDTQAGMVPLSATHVQRAVDLAHAAGADVVVAFVHWGDNYQQVNALQRYWAGQLVAAGFDLVIGTGPHTVNRVDVIDSVPVFYSIGNFVFGSPGRFDVYRQPGVGFAVSLDLPADGQAMLRVRCLVTDNAKVAYQPRPCGVRLADRMLRRFAAPLSVSSGVGSLPVAVSP